MVVGRGTKYNHKTTKSGMGIGIKPSSKSDPIGRGQKPICKTGKGVYEKNTGVVKKG